MATTLFRVSLSAIAASLIAGRAALDDRGDRRALPRLDGSKASLIKELNISAANPSSAEQEIAPREIDPIQPTTCRGTTGLARRRDRLKAVEGIRSIFFQRPDNRLERGWKT